MASVINGVSTYQALLETVQERAADLRPLAETLHKQWMADLAANWDLPDVTGRLRASLTTDNAENIFTASPDMIEMGSRDPASVFNEIPSVDSDASAETLRRWIFFGEK